MICSSASALYSSVPVTTVLVLCKCKMFKYLSMPVSLGLIKQSTSPYLLFPHTYQSAILSLLKQQTKICTFRIRSIVASIKQQYLKLHHYCVSRKTRTILPIFFHSSYILSGHEGNANYTGTSILDFKRLSSIIL